MVVDDSVLVDKVIREARRLASLERSTWEAFVMVLYGGLNPAHVNELIELAGHDARVLEETRRRVKEETGDVTNLRARQLLRRAALRALREQPP
jgi:hypothetical protein